MPVAGRNSGRPRAGSRIGGLRCTLVLQRFQDRKQLTIVPAQIILNTGLLYQGRLAESFARLLCDGSGIQLEEAVGAVRRDLGIDGIWCRLGVGGGRFWERGQTAPAGASRKRSKASN